MSTLRRTHPTLDRILGVLSILAILVGTAGAAQAGESVLAAPTTSRAPDLVGEFLPGRVTPLAHGHAHNDYLHPRPLAQSLEHGYTSIEIDVLLIGDRLLVGHDLLDALLRNETLGDLYLEPLKDWTRANGGKVFADPEPGLTLVVDVKSASGSTYRALHQVLATYGSMLTTFTSTKVRQGPVTVSVEKVNRGPVTVIVSGHRAQALMAAQPLRYAAYDGRAADLDNAPSTPAAEMPMVSDSWARLFRWNGKGAMPVEERQKLERLVEKAHKQGRRLRLYDTPATSYEVREAVWKVEMAARVDLLNIDDLPAGKRFLLSYADPSKPYVRW